MNTPRLAILFLLLLIAPGAHAAQGRAAASAEVISLQDVATIDLDAALTAAAGNAPPSPQPQVTVTDGGLTVSIDYN